MANPADPSIGELGAACVVSVACVAAAVLVALSFDGMLVARFAAFAQVRASPGAVAVARLALGGAAVLGALAAEGLWMARPWRQRATWAWGIWCPAAAALAAGTVVFRDDGLFGAILAGIAGGAFTFLACLLVALMMAVGASAGARSSASP